MSEKMTANEGLILLNQKMGDREEVLRTLAGLAKGQGLVDDSYLPAILAREEEFPTGLELPIPVAIPHIDVGCKKSFVCIATLEEPVEFLSMDRSGTKLEIRIVFLFGILDPKSHLEILRRFAQSFSNKEKITELIEAKSQKEVIDIMNELLDGMLA
ncbi:MAG: PTS sugar transporter subunit IIA [Eubacteriales bacterium]|nr:PTS sugar transporter subunit IIA [Eubacteriales bacterium]